MRNVALTPQQRQEIYELYVEGAPVKDIAELYNITRSTVCKTAIGLGAAPRLVKEYPKTHAPARAKQSCKICSACKKRVNLSEAMYCPYCGQDIRTPAQRLVLRITAAMPKTKLLPDDCRDEFQQLFIDIKAILTKGG